MFMERSISMVSLSTCQGWGWESVCVRVVVVVCARVLGDGGWVGGTACAELCAWAQVSVARVRANS